jgi:hypothetical protein
MVRSGREGLACGLMVVLLRIGGVMTIGAFLTILPADVARVSQPV